MIREALNCCQCLLLFQGMFKFLLHICITVLLASSCSQGRIGDSESRTAGGKKSRAWTQPLDATTGSRLIQCGFGMIKGRWTHGEQKPQATPGFGNRWARGLGRRWEWHTHQHQLCPQASESGPSSAPGDGQCHLHRHPPSESSPAPSFIAFLSCLF